jgi:thiol-disulfide isomerase/thioredoxin
MADISMRPLQNKPVRRHNPWVTRGFYLLLFIVVIWGVNAWRTKGVPAEAPDFAGVQVHGDGRSSSAVSLASFRARHPGEAVALHFWAEWCPVCRTEENSISRLLDDGLPVLTIATQSGDGDAVYATLQERGLRWPAVLDPDGRILAMYRLPGVPALVVIAPDGTVSSAEIGYTSEIGMRLRLWLAGD